MQSEIAKNTEMKSRDAPVAPSRLERQEEEERTILSRIVHRIIQRDPSPPCPRQTGRPGDCIEIARPPDAREFFGGG